MLHGRWDENHKSFPRISSPMHKSTIVCRPQTFPLFDQENLFHLIQKHKGEGGANMNNDPIASKWL